MARGSSANDSGAKWMIRSSLMRLLVLFSFLIGVLISAAFALTVNAIFMTGLIVTAVLMYAGTLMYTPESIRVFSKLWMASAATTVAASLGALVGGQF